MNFSPLLSSLALLILTALASALLTGWVRRVLVNRAILDIPNDRSSHTTPVPRGGGWALVMILLPLMIGAALFFDTLPRHAGLIGGVLALTAISGLDDKKPVSPAIRLALHIVAATLGCLSLPANTLLLNGLVPFALDRALIVLGWAWFINLYNFMDGIDGITSVETIALAGGIGGLIFGAGIDDPFLTCLTLTLAGICLGFLAHNWHPAKIFLGDVGSVPLGYLTGFCLLTLALHGYRVAAFVLPLYYLSDSSITIAKRALRGEKIWQAHREHFYQKAARGAQSHAPVVLLILAGNIGLIGAALVSLSHPWAGWGAGILIVAVLLRKMHKTGMESRRAL